MTSKKKFELTATPRGDVGKGASRRLRREEKVPGIVYGGGKAAASLIFEHRHLTKALADEAFYSHILNLKTGDAAIERVILKDVQRHPYKPRITHIDFQRIRADEKLRMNVPLHFVGGEEAPGVRNSGGLISHLMSDVEISCLPDDLPEYIEVDLANMELNQIIHLSELKLSKGVEIVALTHGHDQPVVSVHVPRVEEPSPLDNAAPVAPSEVPAMAQKADEKKA